MGRRGPKPKPDHEVRHHQLTVRLNDAERDALEEAKKEGGFGSLAETLREAAFSDEDD